MQKVIDYKLFTSDSPQGLTDTVKAAMADNWVPSGIVIQFQDNLIQAMVKFEDTNA